MKKFSNYMPRLVFCMLGNWDSFDTIRGIINEAGFIFDDDESILENDDRMVNSFTVSVDRVNYSMADEEWNDIYSHKAVAYFYTPDVPHEEGLRSVAGRALILVKYLFQNLGVTALKCESAGIAHGRNRWIELSEKYTENGSIDILYQAYVRRPLEGEYGLSSCGMHLLGYPDILYYAVEEDIMKSVKNMDKLSKFIIENNGDIDEIEDELDNLDYDVNEIKHLPDMGHEENDIQHNPYGVIYIDTDLDNE
jgi:hypothetical protein